MMPLVDVRIALVVATCDRPQEMRHLLRSMRDQSRFPDQLIIVDSGRESIEKLLREYNDLNLKYIRSSVRSAALQRNMGVAAVDPSIDFIGFADDDVEFKKDAFEVMMNFWQQAPQDLGGAGFNMKNHPQVEFSNLKRLPFVKMLGLYSPIGGIVLPSGFQTMIGEVISNQPVQWLPTTAVVWKKALFVEFLFDEWFGGYSYLEDLDFSYRVGESYRLTVVADAGYLHHPAAHGRGSGTAFGKREVLNRVHFVKKNPGLSLLKCYLALFIRLLMSLANGIRHGRAYDFARAWGNILGILETLSS